MIETKNVQGRRIELLLVALMGINVFWGALVFMGFLGLDVFGWLIMNICSPSEMVAIIGILTKKRLISSISVPLLLRFGGLGLFIFSWSGFMLQGQLNHILMVLTSIYILWASYKARAWKDLFIGIAIGVTVVVLVDFLVFPLYFANAPPKVKELLKYYK